MINKKTKGMLGLSVSYIILIFFAVASLAPFVFMLVSSFKPGQELMRQGLNLKIDPEVMSLHNYKVLLFEDTRFLNWFKSSVIITVGYTLLGLLFSSMVGYGLAVYNFKFKKIIFFAVLIVMMTPLEILLLPMFKLMITLKLIDNYLGVILPFAAAPIPIFFFRQYIIGIPKEFIEAARIDGCSEFRIFFRIIIPLIKPAIGAMTILMGMTAWNSFLWPLIVLNSTEKLNISVGLATLISPYGENYNMIFPGAVLSVVPIVILFLLNQKRFIEGMTAGGIKQ